MNDNYCKQITCQHFGQGRGRGRVVDPLNIFFSSSLIAVQNLVAVSHTCADI